MSLQPDLKMLIILPRAMKLLLKTFHSYPRFILASIL